MNIIYKVIREFRVDDNRAFLEALEFCNKNKCDNFFIIYSRSNINNWRGEGLEEKNKIVSQKFIDFLDNEILFFKKEIEDFTNNNLYKKFGFKSFATKIHFIIIDTNNPLQDIYDFVINNDVKKIWTDYTPMKEQRNFFLKFKQKYKNIDIVEVDSKNIFPISLISDKEEYSAATFRRKWVKVLKQNYDYIKSIKDPIINNKAVETFNYFLQYKIENYFIDRNNALIDGQSNLSTYINLGRISRRFMLSKILNKYDLEIEDIFNENKNGSGNEALKDSFVKEDYDSLLVEKNKKINKNILEGIRSFVEEFCIRYELAENYCYYNCNYDNILGIRSWARDTLSKALTDKRDFVYSLKDFEDCKTHDPLWNSCQKDLMKNNKLGGYLRMYWCKKILEWTNNPQDAITISIYLNNKYNFDGYSPASYVGILWSIGGLHDRAWFPRQVFGNIRYMARSGVEKRMNVKEYIDKFNSIS